MQGKYCGYHMSQAVERQPSEELSESQPASPQQPEMSSPEPARAKVILRAHIGP